MSSSSVAEGRRDRGDRGVDGRRAGGHGECGERGEAGVGERALGETAAT